MAQVSVTINGRTFRMACEDGEEPHLIGLADRLNATIDELRGAFGEIGDQRLTVMAAISTLDRLAEVERRVGALETQLAARESVRGEAAVAERLNATAETIERLADALSGTRREPVIADAEDE